MENAIEEGAFAEMDSRNDDDIVHVTKIEEVVKNQPIQQLFKIIASAKNWILEDRANAKDALMESLQLRLALRYVMDELRRQYQLIAEGKMKAPVLQPTPQTNILQQDIMNQSQPSFQAPQYQQFQNPQQFPMGNMQMTPQMQQQMYSSQAYQQQQFAMQQFLSPQNIEAFFNITDEQLALLDPIRAEQIQNIRLQVILYDPDIEKYSEPLKQKILQYRHQMSLANPQ